METADRCLVIFYYGVSCSHVCIVASVGKPPIYNVQLHTQTHTGTEIAGVTHWFRPQPHTDGESISLYEHKAGSTQHHGDPIADVFAIVARPNNCILAVADGVNWGIKPRLAARCAVHGCMEYLNSKLFNSPKKPGTTQDIFHHILRSFHTAQKLIIQQGGTTTTLCVAIVVELSPAKSGAPRWGLCVVIVGDTLCYVWRKDTQEVHEVTSATHLGKERNPRDSGGCLGCDLGDQPDLSNLLCCYVPISDGDIVFAVSDGISDNMDPVLLKQAASDTAFTPSTPLFEAEPPFPPPTDPKDALQNSVQPAPLPIVTPEQRQMHVLRKLSDMLRTRYEACDFNLTATNLKDVIITSAIESTEEKRKFLEKCWQEQEGCTITLPEKRANDRKISRVVRTLPGKLDHATIAAYTVGKSFVSNEEDVRRGHSATHSYVMNTRVTETAEGSKRNGKSFAATGGSIFYFNPKKSISVDVPIPGTKELLPTLSFPEHSL